MIRRARREEERLGEMRKGRRERIEKGSHCFFKSSRYDKLELKHKNLVFFKLIECIIKKKICHGVKQFHSTCTSTHIHIRKQFFSCICISKYWAI